MLGGTGKSGWGKHKWTRVIQEGLQGIGKHGFRCPTTPREGFIINVGELEDLAARQKIEAAEKITLDLQALGYRKLLGEGNITKPILVKIAACSKQAAAKIQKAGGEIVKPA